MISHIQKKLSVPELLCQLSEEASELAKAALKLRRAITGDNPTPVTPEQARKDLLEEVADVFLCLRTLEIPLDPAAYYKTMNAKDNRWSERLSKIPEPAPLTLEELRQMEGEPVWIVADHYRTYCDVVRIIGRDKGEERVCFKINGRLQESGHGKTWNAYRHKPKEV